MMGVISVVIPTSKPNNMLIAQTLGSLENSPFQYDLVLSSVSGIGRARNDGVQRAKQDLIVMVDDDIIIDKRVWGIVSNLKEGEFAMKNEDWFNPCSRIMVFYKKDFWSIGGFDEHFKHSAEDRDFFFRAIDSGLKWIKIPEFYMQHIEHVRRGSNFWKGNRIAFDNFRYYFRHHKKHPELLKDDLRFRFRNYQYRTLGIYLIALIYFTLFDHSWKMNDYEIKR